MEVIYGISAFMIALTAIGVLVYREYKLKNALKEKDIDVRRKRYELAILQHIGDRMGHELDADKIVSLVTESLEQFIEYAVVSHMVVHDNEYEFTADLKKSVSKTYITSLKKQMVDSLETLLDTPIKERDLNEYTKGVFVLDAAPDRIHSYFNIPIVIGSSVHGILTVSHYKKQAYAEEDMTVLYKIVSQATQAVTKIGQVVKREQSKLGVMIEGLDDGVLMVDRDLNVIVINSVAREILDLSDDDAVSLDMCMRSIGSRYNVQSFLEDSMTQEKIITTNEVVIRDRYYQVSVSPVKGSKDLPHGTIIGGVVMFHDISNEKEIERLRQDFTSFMVHELRSPLDGIKKVSEMMHDDTIRLKKDSYHEYVKMIHSASSQMLELVNDLLDVTHLENDSLDLSTRESQVKNVVTGRVRFFEVTAEDKGVSLGSIIGEKVPDVCQMDPIRIEQVLNNLLSNAIKYTDEGGSVRLGVFLHTKDSDVMSEASDAGIGWFVTQEEAKQLNKLDDAIVFSVTDSGKGIDAESKKKLLQKFDRKEILKQNHKKSKSLGLGLVIVRGIIERHGGIVGAASKEGEGSTFYFTINV